MHSTPNMERGQLHITQKNDFVYKKRSLTFSYWCVNVLSYICVKIHIFDTNENSLEKNISSVKLKKRKRFVNVSKLIE